MLVNMNTFLPGIKHHSVPPAFSVLIADNKVIDVDIPVLFLFLAFALAKVLLVIATETSFGCLK